MAEDIYERLTQSTAQLDAKEASTSDLIGVFQAFRPDGLPPSLCAELPASSAIFVERLQGVYEAVRNSQRHDNMKDAYFVVRQPRRMSSSEVQVVAQRFVEGLYRLAQEIDLHLLKQVLQQRPQIRILEGKAPRHPKERKEQCDLLVAINEELPLGCDGLFAGGSPGHGLSEALYFVACDKLLRDYLRWPFLADNQPHLAELDSFRDYFMLWECGIKLRIFNDRQLDLYIPR